MALTLKHADLAARVAHSSSTSPELLAQLARAETSLAALTNTCTDNIHEMVAYLHRASFVDTAVIYKEFGLAAADLDDV